MCKTKNLQTLKTNATEKCCNFTPQEEEKEDEEESWLSFGEESKETFPFVFFKHLAVIFYNIIEANNIK